MIAVPIFSFLQIPCEREPTLLIDRTNFNRQRITTKPSGLRIVERDRQKWIFFARGQKKRTSNLDLGAVDAHNGASVRHYCTGIVVPGNRRTSGARSVDMAEFLLSPPAQAVIWTAVLVAMIVVAVFFVHGCRRWQRDDRTSANELLTEFRNLRDSGSVSQAEFKNIKSVLGEKLQDELGSNKSDNSG